jgi:serine/threonine protein kinase/Flp pilus assembly protein TadD
MISTRKVCDTCGSSLEWDMPSGFCPACLLNTALEPDSAVAPGGRFEDYELLDEVARGGMGIVYRARQRMPSRIVALKMILPVHLNSSGAVNRFHGEAEAAASLEHESILPIYAVGERDGTPFYSMKFAEGGTLSGRLADYHDKPREAAALIAKLARAVDYAHECRILHRDLKPGNVLFDSAGKPYVSDFGLAKWLQRECDLTQTLAILGTPYYMAPEQATDSRAVTAAADIYSLGAILYHLLAGHPPTEGETPIEVLHRAGAQTPRLTNRRVPRDLATICLKCLEKEPTARYASAADLADDLERFCADLPIRARPAGLTSRSWRWMRRNPVTVALTALSIALLITLSSRTEWNAEQTPTKNREAYALYQKGIAAMRSPAIDSAADEEPQHYFEQAIALDPRFALAHACLSLVHSDIYARFSQAEIHRRRAKAEAEEALHLQTNLGEAHLAFATYRSRVEHDYDAALQQYEIARRTIPNDAYVFHGSGHAHMHRGDYDQAIADFERATALDPNNADMWDELGDAYGAVRKYSAAEHAKRQMLEVLGNVPTAVRVTEEQAWGWAYLCLTGSFEKLDEIFARGMLNAKDDPDGVVAFHRFDVRMCERDFADAEKTLKAAAPATLFDMWTSARVTKGFLFGTLALAQGDVATARPFFEGEVQFAQQEVREMPESAPRHAQLGLVYAFLGRNEEAIAEGRRAVELLPLSKDAFDGVGPLFNLAMIYARVAEAEQAIDLLDKLLRTPNGPPAVELQFWPWDPLRDNPRFQELVARTAR